LLDRSVYNEFGDFDGLILTVNRETVQALTARSSRSAEDPVRQLHGLAETYLTFAADHANLLRCCSNTGWRTTGLSPKTSC
jgi:hypothetical protein